MESQRPVFDVGHLSLDWLEMNGNIPAVFLLLIILQAIHAAEEFIFRIYERFPPMRFLYQNAPYLAKPAFAIFNTVLVLVGMGCFYYWVQPARKGVRVVVWVLIIIESLNLVAHLVWAVLIGGSNPRFVYGGLIFT